MSDIVERLRLLEKVLDDERWNSLFIETASEAADTIEALRKERDDLIHDMERQADALNEYVNVSAPVSIKLMIKDSCGRGVSGARVYINDGFGGIFSDKELSTKHTYPVACDINGDSPTIYLQPQDGEE